VRVALVAAGVGDEASGVAHVVRALARNLGCCKVRVTIVAAEAGGHPPTVENVEVHTVASFALARGIGLAPGFARAIRGISASCDCVAVHGFWAPALVFGALSAARSGAPVLLSPHGMLSNYSFRFRGLRKRAALALGFRGVLQSVTAFHATSEAERHDIRVLGLGQPIHVVPNGVLLPDLSDVRVRRDEARTILFLSRVHPKKGLPLLLHAWAALAERRPQWRLQVAGPDELSHLAEIEALARDLGVPRLQFLGPLYGREKQEALQNADVFVLPSHNENFGLVVAEALACGTPVITTTATPWSGVVHADCGWWVEPTIEGIAAALDEATSLPVERLQSMGRAGRAMVAASYSWPAVASQYRAALEATIAAHRGEPQAQLAT
jgi:glycosyltransferase involved in cell wall biosynthesis